jgi:hypothetical protein
MTPSRFTSVAVALTALALASSRAPSSAGIAHTVSPARDAQRAPRNLPPGRYVVEVAVRDTRRNAGRTAFRLDVSDR